jgi:hypothetical protein
MSSEVLLSSIIPFAGSGFLGYAMGFALLFLSRTWLLVKCSSYSVRVFTAYTTRPNRGPFYHFNPSCHLHLLRMACIFPDHVTVLSSN